MMSTSSVVVASAKTGLLLRSFGRRVYQQSTSPVSLTVLGWTTVVSPALAVATRCDDGKGSGGGGGNNGEDWMSKLQSLSDSVASNAGTQLQTAIDSGIPTQVSYGFVSGYCSGYALKKAGRVAAVVFGKYYCIIFVTINFVKIAYGKYFCFFHTQKSFTSFCCC